MSGRPPPDHGRAPGGETLEAAAAATSPVGEVDRADRVAQRLAVPVLIAALASVPAVFLSLMAEPWGTIGAHLNGLSGAVLIAETVVLLVIAEDRRAWLRRNRWLVVLAAAIVPAVVFAVGPVQLLRLLRVVGALRVIRVGRILKAGRLVRERTGIDHGWQRAVGIAVTLACAAFVAMVLADPTSSSRQVVDGAVQRFGVLGVLLAGVLLAIATFVVRTARGRRPSTTDAAGTADRNATGG